MSIRFASKDDCAAIAEIYNHAVLHTAAIWNDQTVDAENRISWYEARQLMGYPVLVSEENGVVTGYASFGDWRNFDGFRHTVEHSVYVHPEHQGKDWGAGCSADSLKKRARVASMSWWQELSRTIRHRSTCIARWVSILPRRCPRSGLNLVVGWI